MHAGSVGIENSQDLDLDAMLAVAVEKERLGAPLGFIVA
jgi:hypothetical protein